MLLPEFVEIKLLVYNNGGIYCKRIQERTAKMKILKDSIKRVTTLFKPILGICRNGMELQFLVKSLLFL